ncbi:uncharacterized protein LOC124305311 isoform X2 [Neodiprion virginianus]|uniref:uncharacterized protein LOC124305311 isoform X2 n=1 Tax=Neodiprion virginianus TaxID=2961670 RepID=UPI001EE76E42|nr:uncharacterized protein LOC124305311 isoform X2 [Neodiprion virginianus]
MPLNTDISAALLLLEQVQERVKSCDDPKLQLHTSDDLEALISLLEDPVFRSIVTIQDSLTDLNAQLGHHPSILPGDFDINLGGQLELSLPSTPAQPLGPNMYQDIYQDGSELDDQRVPVARLVHSSSEDTSAQVTSPSLASEDLSMPPITTPTYAKEFQKVIEAASKGRQIYTVQLYKPEGTSLGFSVVGLRSKDKGELGIFLQEIQPNGIAGCDGRLVEGDQILAIDGQPLDSNISHEQAISILQKARGLVELVVARSAQEVGSSLTPDELSGASNSTTATAGGNSGVAAGAAGAGSQTQSEKEPHSCAGSVSVSTAVSSIATGTPPATSSISSVNPATQNNPQPSAPAAATPGLVVERSPSAVSDASRTGSDMVLNTEWAQVEVINLINDGSGLGFGIIGGRSTGVVVKTILPGGVADRDNRLQSGDHILQIGDVNLRGMGSEQVAAVLRQSGTHVRLVVARPVEPTSPDYQALGSHAPIVPTRILGDPDELERHLVHSVPESCNRNGPSGENNYDNGYMYSQEPENEMHARPGLIMDVVRNPVPVSAVPVIATTPGGQMPNLPVISMDPLDVGSLPEMERFTVELKKDIYGLGITIAGYVCEKEELSGIFVKSISEGSAADLSNKIQINDRIVEVDGHSLQGYSNHEAVEVLRSTGQSVTLCLERYLRGPKYETLQQAIAASEQGPQQPGSPSIASLPSFPISADGETTTEIEPEGESHTTVDSSVMQERERDDSVGLRDEASNVEALLSDPSAELTPQIRASIKSKWQKIVGPDTEIIVAQLKKFAEGSGLGISLEGTVDVEDGQEVRPHHYIRSILPEGPVGQNGCLRSGDELLEVNGYRLLGINHMEVVSVLKELPLHVRMVCGRNIASQDPLCPIDTAQHQAAFQTRSILGGSLQNLLPAMDRLVKAKSDGSLASTTTTATVTDASLSKMKSRSLEPLTGLAMWSSEPQIIELIKGERGLGFSILDYQDPMNPNETVIVIRSLVPGGVAQVDGQLIPGDRLLFVNDIALENATLDQAVQALKGAPKGTVRIGVAKPLPIPDSIAQLVTPICIVRRSRSLPDDTESTNHAPELADLGDLNDVCTSSKSGTSGNSVDKQDPEADEEGEKFEDASPLTPICSPSKKPGSRSSSTLKSGILENASPAGPPANSTNSARDLLLFADDVVPVVNVTILREVTSPAKDEEIAKDLAVYDTGPSTSTYRQERRKSVKRQGSLVKEKSLEDESTVEVPLLRERRKSLKEVDEAARRLAKDRRKSLKEQKSIERVNEYLAKHSSVESCCQDQEQRRESLCVDVGLLRSSSERRKSLTKQDRVEIPPDTRSDEVPEVLRSPHKEMPDTVRKEVKIRERVEDDREDPAIVPEVRLVKAKIISAEEAAAVLVGRLENKSTPEVSTVGEDKVRSRIKKSALSAEEDDETLLSLPALTKSTSENVLVEIEEENTVSVKNFRPDILLDLSKVEESRDSVTSSKKDKRVLSRVGSEGSKKIVEPILVRHRQNYSAVVTSTLSTSIQRQDKETSDTVVLTTTDAEPSGVVSESERLVLRDCDVPMDLDSVSCAPLRRSHDPDQDSPKLPVTGSLPEADTPSARPKETVGEEPEVLKTCNGESLTSETHPKEPRHCSESSGDTRRKPEVVTKTVYKSDFPLKKHECSGYKSVNQRLRERDFTGAFSVSTKDPEPFVSRLQQPSKRSQEASGGVQQILTTDKEAEEQRQKALERQREHEKFLQERRSLLEQEDEGKDKPIGKQHSLEYQRQTLEARLEELSDREPEAPRREAETQTHQETKSTQCGGTEASDSESSCRSVAEGGSPRREVQTQTQAETKGTQCELDDLAETFSQLKTFFRQKTATPSPNASPRREVEVQTEQESKSVQCAPEDIPDSPLRTAIFFRRGVNGDQKSLESGRREVEVQTYQESKGTQVAEDEELERTQTVPKDRKFPFHCPEPPEESTASNSPIIVLVDGRSDMTVTHNYKDKDGNVVWAKHWGPERMVEIYREPKSSLGLSIVGGKVDLYHGGPNTSQNISGIFIKNVLPNSPAGRTGDLKTGDRIIEVDGIDLRNSTHERAVQAIQAAGNPVCLLVQSLVHLSPDDHERTSSSRELDENATGRGIRRQGTRGHGAIAGAPSSSFRRKPSTASPARAITPELIQEGIEDEARQGTSRSDFRRQSTRNDQDAAGPSRRSSMKQSLRKKAPSPPKGAGTLREVSEEGEDQPAQQAKSEGPRPKYSSDESSDEEDTRDLEGNVYTKAGIEISRKSAGNVKRTKEEIEADPEPEDKFGYTSKKIKKRYDALGHPVVMVRLEKDRRGLGISLAGHKDRNRMAVFVCGLNPKGVAHKTGGLLIGDEILEVNGTVLQGRCHLNASAMIKGMAGPTFKVIVLRRSSAVNDLAVKPIVQFPPTLDEDDPNRFSQYKGVRTVAIKKGQYGLGIMIIEGKHAEVGQGIFVSDIQEGSAAEQAGLQVGDMILAVNLDSLLGSSYDEATGLLKKTEGVVTLTVCNPNQSKLAKEEEERAKGGDSASPNGIDASKSDKEPEKPKEPEPPKDPKDCEISVGRETTIEFTKDKEKAIGLSIAGGSSTPLGGIVILEVFPEGAAGKDGRLKPGDQIVEMCHESFKAIEYAKAHEAILKASGQIHMVVLREEKPPDEFDVELPKKSGKGVGLCLTGFKSGKGAFVSDMLPGGSALESGKIAKGDRVVSVNGQDVREAPVEDIALHVKVANPVQLKLARYKPVKQ